ncbi:MAG: DNA repair protein RecO [Clostridiales bacterium]|nr:DNA repair protein RecO [Clostridiales bacterium]
MPKDILNGIVLRTTDYRESDRILNVLTKERGLVAVTARGCRKPNSKLAAFSAQFIYGEMEVTERAGKLQLSSAAVLESFYPIRESYEKLLSATRIAAASERVSEGAGAFDDLFLLLYHALSVIAYGDGVPKDTELCFIAKLLKLEGFAPALTYCLRCGRDLRGEKEVRFSNSLGGSVCERCGSAFVTVSTLSLEALRRMMLIDVQELRRVRLPDKVREELDRLIYNYAEYVFEFTMKR